MQNKLIAYAKKDIGILRGLILLGAIIVIFFTILLFLSNKHKEGYVNNFDQLFAILNIKPVFTNFENRGKLYYKLTGSSNAWEVNILGEFSPDIVYAIDQFPERLGLPQPQISYANHIPISGLEFNIPMPPETLSQKLMLTKSVHSKGKIISLISDNIVYFHGKKDGYMYELYILGKRHYFILRIIRLR